METVRDKLRNPWVRLIGVVILAGLFGWLVYGVRNVLVPFALALIVAYILDPVVDALQRRKVPRPLAIVLLVLCVLIAAGGITLFVVLDVQASLAEGRAAVEKQADESTEKGKQEQDAASESAPEKPPAPEGEEKPGEGETGEGQPGDEDILPDGKEKESAAEDWVDRQLQAAIDYLPEKYRDMARSVAVRVYEEVKSRFNEILRSVAEAASKAGKTAWGAVSWIVNFAVFAVATLYLLNDIDRVRDMAVAHLPLRYKDRVIDIAVKIDRDLRSFFRGQLVVALILGAVYFVGLTIAGIPYALPVALIGGLGNFIPYLGTVLGVTSAMLASVAGHGFDIHLLYVLIVFAIAQLLEGNLVTPKIVGKSVGLNPVAVIFSIMIFGKLLGFFGILFAIPLASATRVLAGELLPKIDLHDHRKDEEEPPAGGEGKQGQTEDEGD